MATQGRGPVCHAKGRVVCSDVSTAWVGGWNVWDVA